MSAFLKPVLVLIISILVFAGIAYLADNEILEFIQAKFFNPSIVNSYVRKNNSDAEISQNHIFELQEKFADTLTEPAVQRSFLYNQDAEDIYERSGIFGRLIESTGGLQMVQFIDSNGLRIHYSTNYHDIIEQSQASTSYRNYNEDETALPYDDVSALEGESPKFIMDENGERIIFSFPFIDSMDVYRGTALFSVSIRALAEKLIAEGSITINEDVSIIGAPQGILFGAPALSKKDIHEKVSAVWNEGLPGRVTLDAEDTGLIFSLISFKNDYGIYFGRIINDALFSISDTMKKILYLSMFFTFYLALYFLINFRPNAATVVHNRIRRLRENLFEQLYVNKSNQERAKWIFELEQRRDEIRSELKNKLKITHHAEKKIDGMIDHSWDELLAVMKSGSGVFTPVKAAKTETASTAAADDVEEMEEVEALEEAEPSVEYDEDEELEEIDEEADEVEAIEEVEDIEEAEEAENVEEIEEAKEVDEIEEAVPVEEIVSIEEAVLVEEIDEAADIESYEEADESEIINDLKDSALTDALAAAAEEFVEINDELNEINEAEETESDAKPEIIVADVIFDKTADTAQVPKEKDINPRRGLLAIASEIEFNYKAKVQEPEEELDFEVNIVSPFDSLLSAFSEKDLSALETDLSALETDLSAPADASGETAPEKKSGRRGTSKKSGSTKKRGSPLKRKRSSLSSKTVIETEVLQDSSENDAVSLTEETVEETPAYESQDLPAEDNNSLTEEEPLIRRIPFISERKRRTKTTPPSAAPVVSQKPQRAAKTAGSPQKGRITGKRRAAKSDLLSLPWEKSADEEISVLPWENTTRNTDDDNLLSLPWNKRSKQNEDLLSLPWEKKPAKKRKK